MLTTTLLDRLGALPLHASIIVDLEGKIFVGGKQLTHETAKRMHESSRSMLHNFARRFVREQVTYMAIEKGVHENLSPEQGLFSKAALWIYQEEDKLYRQFAQSEDDDDVQEHTL